MKSAPNRPPQFCPSCYAYARWLAAQRAGLDCPRSRPRFNRYAAGSLKGKNTERDPRVSLSIIDFDDPYTEAQMRGSVIERRPDPQLKYYDSLSHKYIGKPWPYREKKVQSFSSLRSPKQNTPSSHSSIRRPRDSGHKVRLTLLPRASTI